ncbi:MAG: hypothetical protein WKF84_10510 [Pyrinomonadaceae bacterium]
MVYAGAGARDLFTKTTPPEIIAEVAGKVKHESLRCYFDMFYLWNRPRPRLLKNVPMLFIGAEDDAILHAQRDSGLG